MRTLILLRHAKSDYPGGTSDHDRPLAPRGTAEAALAGDWLREHQPPIGLVLTSSALRARETVQASGIDAPIDIRPEIYDATPEDILVQIHTVADDVGVLLVVGHAPGIPGLASELSGPGSKKRLVRQAQESFRTATLAVLTVRGSWAELDADGAILIAVHSARP